MKEDNCAKINQELEAIRSNAGGILKCEDVVAFAEDESTSLHGRFDWDDSVAGHKWRLEQAGQVIRAAVTILRGKDEPIRAYCHIVTDRANGGGYRSIAEVMEDDQKRDTLIEQALQDIKRFEKRYRDIVSLKSVMDAIDDVRADLVPT